MKILQVTYRSLQKCINNSSNASERPSAVSVSVQSENYVGAVQFPKSSPRMAAEH